MDVKEPGEIELTISYLVWGASWTPRYDIRAFSEDAIVKVRHKSFAYSFDPHFTAVKRFWISSKDEWEIFLLLLMIILGTQVIGDIFFFLP